MKPRLNWLPTVGVITLLTVASSLRTSHATAVHRLQDDHPFAFTLYDAILSATDISKGSIHVKLRPFDGRTSGTNLEKNARWRVPSGTTAHITFNLQNKAWEQLTIEFDRPLEIELLVDTPPSATLLIGKITYDRNGRVKDLFDAGSDNTQARTEFVRKGQQAATSLGFFREALVPLGIIPNIKALLARESGNNGPLGFQSVEIAENSSDSLVVNLRQGTRLPLGIDNSTGCHLDSLNVSDKTSLSFSSLSFEVSTKILAATLRRFGANVSDACFASGETVIRTGGGSQIGIEQLRFGRTLTSSFLALQASQIDSQLMSGSSLALAGSGERQNTLKLLDSGRLKARLLGFEVKEDGTKLLSLTSAEVNTGEATGVLASNATNYLSFRTPKTELRIFSAEWSDSAPPRFQGSLLPMQFEITAGALLLNSANRFSIQSGTAATASLAIDTSNSSPISGAMSLTSLFLGKGSVIGTTNRFMLESEAGKLIVERDNHIFFSRENQAVNAKINFSIPTTKGSISFRDNKGVLVNAGSIEAALDNSPGASFSGLIKGRLLISSGQIPLGQNSSADVAKGQLDFDRLAFTETNGLTGALTGLALNLSTSVTTLSSTLHFSPSVDALIDLAPGSPLPEISNSGLKGSVRLNAPFTEGEAEMAAGGFFQLGIGTIRGIVTTAGDAPASGSVKLITELSGGIVTLDPATSITLTSGSKIATDFLMLNQDGSLSGSVVSWFFQLKPDSSLTAVRGRKLTIADGSSYQGKDNSPLTFSVGEDSPTGQGQLVARFSELSYPNSRVLLRRGEVKALLSRSPKQVLEWNNPVVTEQQEWNHPLITAEQQIGSYTSVADVPDDEYSVLSRSSSDKIESIKAPNRVIIVNTVPIAVNTKATFSPNGLLSHAILAEDTTIFGIPLAGGAPVEVDPSHLMVLVGTIGRDTTIDGIPYSKGCLAHLPPTDLDHRVPPCEAITSLVFRIKTSDAVLSSAYAPTLNLKVAIEDLLKLPTEDLSKLRFEDLFQETKDDIWIDIGPKAWRIPSDSRENSPANMRISGDFRTGETATIEILNPAIGERGSCSALDDQEVPLFVGDIRGIRLEKKGISLPVICGLAEGPDNQFDFLSNSLNPPKLTDILTTLKGTVQLRRQVLDFWRNQLSTINEKIDKIKPVIGAAQSAVDEFESKQRDLDSFQRSVIEKQGKVAGAVCELLCGEKCLLGKCVSLPCPESEVCKLLKEIIQLQGKILDAQTWLRDHAVGYAKATATLAAKLALDLQLSSVNKEIEVLNALDDRVQKVADYIAKLESLITHAKPGVDIPSPGHWRPESITMIVNGREFPAPFTINQSLKQGQSEWESDRNAIRTMSDQESFVLGLRVNVNKSSGSDDYVSFIATPLVKMRGFTGWDVIDDVKNVTVTGVLAHPPGFGLDAGVSFDLKIKDILVDGVPFTLDGTKGFRQRYIRVEYRFGTDDRFRSWHEGDTLTVTGNIFRDRDKNTFYEIHLKEAANINRIAQAP